MRLGDINRWVGFYYSPNSFIGFNDDQVYTIPFSGYYHIKVSNPGFSTVITGV